MSESLLMTDPYRSLGEPMTFIGRLEHLYRVLREHYEGVHRFALALYDEADQTVSSFIYESDDGSPLVGYSQPLENAPSLSLLAREQAVRVVEDMRIFRSDDDQKPHSEALLSSGLRASFTMALRYNGRLLGFLFLNSRQIGYFGPEKQAYCNLWAHLIEQLLVRERVEVDRIQSLIRFATDISGRRSVETDGHVKRMAQFSRLIARGLQGSHQLSDDYIEYITLFAPMHDIGKVAISDAILHKPDSLTADEYEEMRRHVGIGQDIVDNAIQEFSLGGMEHTDMLRHIVLLHHEKMNGSGYMGCEGEAEIPLEARIVAVADILDALLSRRSYKDAWPLEKTLQELARMADHELDRACVQVILDNPEKIQQIRQRYP